MIPARLVRAIDQASLVTMVWAAGNDYQDCLERGQSTSITCVESGSGSISTGVVDRFMQPHAYTGRGPGYCSPLQPFISVPTYGVLPWGPGWIDTGKQGGGTSAGAPLIAAACALLRSVYPGATNLQIRAALAASARPLGKLPGWDSATGFGLLQADKAIQLLPDVHHHPYYHQIARVMYQPLPFPVLAQAVRDF